MLSKNLYNYINYQLRQEYFNNGKLLNKYQLLKSLAKENQIDYRALPIQTSQQIIFKLFDNWESYFKALKSYNKNPSKFNGKPRIPKYKKKVGLNLVIFTNQQCEIKKMVIYTFRRK